MKLKIGLLVGILALASAVSAAKDEDDPLARFDRTGEMVNCVDSRSASIRAVDEDTLLVRVGVSDYYLNETNGTCNNADSAFTRFEMTLYGTRFCRGEIVRIVDNTTGFFQGACSFGEFEKLTKKPVPDQPAK